MNRENKKIPRTITDVAEIKAIDTNTSWESALCFSKHD